MKEPIRTHIFHMALIAAVAFAAFGLGRLSAVEDSQSPISISYFEQAPGAQTATALQAFSATEEANAGALVASKSGTAYHFQWCPGAKAIADANKVYFDTPEAAKAAGYKPAKNCKGLQ